MSTIIDEMRAALPPYVDIKRVRNWAERLERSGALVPVPDGEKCRPHDCGMFIVDGKVFDAYGVNSVDGTMPMCPDFVQPVRLVPIAEAQIDE